MAQWASLPETPICPTGTRRAGRPTAAEWRRPPGKRPDWSASRDSGLRLQTRFLRGLVPAGSCRTETRKKQRRPIALPSCVSPSEISYPGPQERRQDEHAASSGLVGQFPTLPGRRLGIGSDEVDLVADQLGQRTKPGKSRVRTQCATTQERRPAPAPGCALVCLAMDQATIVSSPPIREQRKCDSHFSRKSSVSNHSRVSSSSGGGSSGSAVGSGSGGVARVSSVSKGCGRQDR